MSAASAGHTGTHENRHKAFTQFICLGGERVKRRPRWKHCCSGVITNVHAIRYNHPLLLADWGFFFFFTFSRSTKVTWKVKTCSQIKVIIKNDHQYVFIVDMTVNIVWMVQNIHTT